jgi:hypothetical protein
VALQSITDRPGRNIYRSSPFTQHNSESAKMRSSDRVIKVKPIPGMKARSSSGALDHRVYSGDAKLHATQDSTGLWGLYMEGGIIPPNLKDRKWTRWDDLLTSVGNYFRPRNLEIAEVID